MTPRLPPGVYGITDPDLLPETVLAERVAAAIAGGAVTIQYRDKTGSPADRLRRAVALARVCRARGAVFIVNDDPALAVEADAHGVHVGQDDAAFAEARALVGPRRLVGVSCYNRLDLALAAERAGADYVAFGSVFASATKPGAVAASLDLITEAAGRLSVPVVAIGGITRDNAGLAVGAGAHAVAVIRDLFADPDPAAAARALREACGRARGRIE